MHFFKILDITKKCFKMPTFILYSSKYLVKQVRFIFQGYLLLPDDINDNPRSTTVNNNIIPLYALPFFNHDEPTMPSKCYSSGYMKEHYDSKWNVFKN